MFGRNSIRFNDPFRLSPLGRVRAGISWLRGPAVVSRWLMLGIVTALVTALVLTVGRSVLRRDAAPQVDDGIVRSWPDVSGLVSAAGVSDCHRLADRPPLTLDGYTFWGTTALPVVIDRSLHVWGPRCVIGAGVVTAGNHAVPGRSSGSSMRAWSPPSWEEFVAGPASAELLEVPGLSNCKVGDRPSPWSTSDSGDPFVAVIDQAGRLWGPMCLVSSGIAAS
jgi:hypothetical protein